MVGAQPDETFRSLMDAAMARNVLALSRNAAGTPPFQALAAFRSGPVGTAIVNTIGPLKDLVQGTVGGSEQSLVIVEGTIAEPGKVVLVQRP